MKSFLAQQSERIHNPALNEAIGRGEGAEILARLIASFLKIAFYGAGLVLLFFLIFNAIRWLTSGGDKEKTAKAQQGITAALIGFAIFISIFAVINYIAPVLGLDFLNILRIEWPTFGPTE